MTVGTQNIANEFISVTPLLKYHEIKNKIIHMKYQISYQSKVDPRSWVFSHRPLLCCTNREQCNPGTDLFWWHLLPFRSDDILPKRLHSNSTAPMPRQTMDLSLSKHCVPLNPVVNHLFAHHFADFWRAILPMFIHFSGPTDGAGCFEMLWNRLSPLLGPGSTPALPNLQWKTAQRQFVNDSGHDKFSPSPRFWWSKSPKFGF